MKKISTRSAQRRKRLNDAGRFELKEKFYPAIKTCVANRYRIILALAVFNGFFVSSPQFLKAMYRSHWAVLPPIFFTLFAIHNFLNYWGNQTDQYRLEGTPRKFWAKCCKAYLEISSCLVTSAAAWLVYAALGAYAGCLQ